MKSPWGIDNLNVQEKNKQQLDALKEECILYATVFNSQEGIKVLNKLKKLTLEKPTWDPAQPEKYGYYREGQNDILRHIISHINKAKEF